MTPLSKGLLIGLFALLPAAAEACRIGADGDVAPYRPTVSRTGSAVMIEQADRLVIVMAGTRAVEQVKTFTGAADRAGRAMPVQVTIAADANGEGGAVVWIDDRKVQTTGEAVVESIPRRPAGEPARCAEAASDEAVMQFGDDPSVRNWAAAPAVIARARGMLSDLRDRLSAAIAIGIAAKATLERVDIETQAWLGR
ncbi:MAG TPA: hypothetical protein VL899_18280 [Alphaproteobacteria bacterium]|nr:hypothetical protein [Alphaproteobacteria bacterium]